MRDARRTLDNMLQIVMSGSLWVLLLTLHWVTREVLGAEMCTKSVPVGATPMKKVSVLRRVPASCSNWEKAWAWITKRNCGTMYRLDMVEVPSPKSVTYRVVKVCCEGDIQCQQTQEEDMTTKGEDIAEEKVLSIVLGSCAAVLIIVVLIVTISLCRRKKRCCLTCEERKHVYVSSVEEDESSELQIHKGYRPQPQQTAHNKVCESEYAEIHEVGLPRYTDIFREEVNTDDFLQPTAPPICLYESRAEGPLTNHKTSEDATDDCDVREVGGDATDPAQRKMVSGQSSHHTVNQNITGCHSVRQHPQNENRVYHNHPVSSSTEDDSAVVVTGAPSLPLTSALHPHTAKDRRCCDGRGDGVGESSQSSTCQDKAGWVRYETLSPKRGTDCHGYQRLSTSAATDETGK